MKKMSLVLTIMLSGLCVSAQEVGVKVDKVNASEETTISIKKGATGNKKIYSVVEGEHDVTGDKDVVAKGAEKNWKAACTEWKKEFREDNKENKIISMTCGRMTCDKEGVETTCKSLAKYKIRTLAEE